MPETAPISFVKTEHPQVRSAAKQKHQWQIGDGNQMT
jgi:hypothetical protein